MLLFDCPYDQLFNYVSGFAAALLEKSSDEARLGHFFKIRHFFHFLRESNVFIIMVKKASQVKSCRKKFTEFGQGMFCIIF
jgi:hypothetical protein